MTKLLKDYGDTLERAQAQGAEGGPDAGARQLRMLRCVLLLLHLTGAPALDLLAHGSCISETMCQLANL